VDRATEQPCELGKSRSWSLGEIRWHGDDAAADDGDALEIGAVARRREDDGGAT
jgi:hypothetical protein